MKPNIDLIPLVLIFVTLAILSFVATRWNNIQQYVHTFDQTQIAITPTIVQDTVFEQRVRKLEAFLSKYKSPLYPYSRHIVNKAQEYEIDYRLIPAIAMNESTLCQNIHNGSYNCWGWGIYGDRITEFDSYEDAINVIAKGIRKNYYDKGMSTPAAIMKVYTPSSPDGIWAKKIEWAYRQIEK